MNLCKINGEIYFEKLNANSTYSLAKFEPTTYGLLVNDLSFSHQDMIAEGVGYYYLPTVEFSRDQWQLKMNLGQSPIIYDNRSISPEALARLGKISSIRIMFERVPPKKAKMIRVALSDLGYKRAPSAH